MESAAIASGLFSNVILKSPFLDLSVSESLCDLYLNYRNVNFYTVHFPQLFSATPVDGIEKKIDRAVAYGVTHYSDIARLALLYKYGGFYLDLDVIVLDKLVNLSNVVTLEYAKPK